MPGHLDGFGKIGSSVGKDFLKDEHKEVVLDEHGEPKMEDEDEITQEEGEEVSTKKFHLKGEKLAGKKFKVPDPEVIRGLVLQSTSLDDLHGRINSKYPNFRLPNQEEIDALLENKQQNIQKLRTKMNVTEAHFNFLHTDTEGKIVRSERYDESGKSVPTKTSDQDMRRLISTDNIFLVYDPSKESIKKTNA